MVFDRDLRRRNATPNTNTNDGIHIRGSGTAVTAVWPAKIDSPAIVLIAAEFKVSAALEPVPLTVKFTHP